MTTGTLRLPRLGETMEEGRIVAWLVAPGEAFARGDALLEVETDKTVVEVPALGPGILAEQLAAEGATVSLGTPLARIDLGAGPDWTGTSDTPGAGTGFQSSGDPKPLDGGEGTPSVPTHAVDPNTTATASQSPSNSVAASPRATLSQTVQSPGSDPIGTQAAGEASDRPRATPVARRLARQHGLDLAVIVGTGRRGRVERADIEAALAGIGPGARQMAQETTGTAANAGSAGLAYDLDGPAGGPPVLLLHGFGGDRTAWAPTASALIRAGCRVLVPDLPGHGATDVEARDAAALSSGLAALVATALPGGAPHIVAHSLGASPALDIAEQRPPASLTLIAPAGLSPQVDGAFLHALAAPDSPGALAHLLDRLPATPIALSDDLLDVIHASLARGRLISLATAIAAPDGQQRLYLRARLARLAEQTPVRLILGQRDTIVPWAPAAAVSPRIATHLLPDAGHVPHWEAPETVAAILRTAILR